MTIPYHVEQPIVGEQLVAMLDRAGIKRAAVLSDAYYFDAPVHATALGDVGVHDVYAAVRAENDWTAREVARFPHRLVGFCSFNPLKEYAPQELNRCAETLTFKGVKLHFSASAVDLTNKQHVERVRRIFAVANSHRLAITVHVRGGRSYGREHADIFLNQLLPAALDIPVQIAHLWGGDGFSEGAVAALVAYADAVSAHHRATRNLYFDVTQLALILDGQKDALQTMATLIRRIGVGRILYGSDGPMLGMFSPMRLGVRSGERCRLRLKSSGLSRTTSRPYRTVEKGEAHMRWISLQQGLLRRPSRLPSLVTIAVLVLAASPAGQAKRYPLDSTTGLRPHNVVAEPAVLQGKKGVRIRHSEEALRRLEKIRGEEQARFPQLAAIEGLEFANGMIEAEIAGYTATQGGALGASSASPSGCQPTSRRMTRFTFGRQTAAQTTKSGAITPFSTSHTRTGPGFGFARKARRSMNR